MDIQKLEELVSDCIVVHRTNFDELKKKWTLLVDRYENKLRENSISAKTRSKVTLGGAYALVENYVARLLNRQPKYKYLGREGDDVKDADLYEEFSEYQFNEAECETELEEIARWGGVCGFAGWKMGWKEETQVQMKDGISIMGIEVVNPIIQKLAKAVGKGKKVKVAEEVTTANYTLNAIKPHDLIWNSDARRFKDVRIFGHKEERFISDLKQQGYDTKGLELTIKTDKDYWTKQLDGNKTLTESQVMEMQKVEVAEMYVKYLDGNIWKNSMMTMAGLSTGKPVKIQFNERPFDQPFMPMGIFTPVKRPGKMPGFGIIEPVVGILDGEEDSFNITLTALWMDVARPVEYDPQNILDMESFEYSGGSLVPVRTLGKSLAVMPTPVPNILGTDKMTQYLLTAKQNVSGVTDFQTGAQQVAGPKTLGEVQIKTAESNARLQKIIRNFELQVLEPMGKYALYMNKQFLADKPKVVYKVLGKKGALLEKAIKSKDIEAIKDITVVAGSTALIDQTAVLQKWTAVLGAVYNEEKSPNPTQINKEPIWEKIFSDGLLQPDIETYLPSAQELEANQAGGNMNQMGAAEQESDNPALARVMPTDNPAVHLPIHMAVAKKGLNSQHQPLSPEDMVALHQHINDHTRQAGGAVPPFSQHMEGALGQHIQNQVPPSPMEQQQANIKANPQR